MLYSSSFSSFSQEDHSRLRFSERSCFLEDIEASFVPCDTDLEPLATQEVASAHEPKTALEALSLNGDLLRNILRWSLSLPTKQNHSKTEPLKSSEWWIRAV